MFSSRQTHDILVASDVILASCRNRATFFSRSPRCTTYSCPAPEIRPKQHVSCFMGQTKPLTCCTYGLTITTVRSHCPVWGIGSCCCVHHDPPSCQWSMETIGALWVIMIVKCQFIIIRCLYGVRCIHQFQCLVIPCQARIL